MRYIVLAESGSTRTEWRILSDQGENLVFETTGLNPYYVDEREVFLVLSMNFPDRIDKNSVEEVWFYGAGCWYEEQCRLIFQALLPHFEKARIHVLSDILGASRGLFMDQPGIAAVLGTGASSCYYDGQDIAEYQKPLGYILGDEGSGAYLGKQLIVKYIRKELPLRLITDFYQKYGYGAEQLLNSVYAADFPNRFLAGFTEFIHSHRKVPEIDAIIYDGFERFFDLNICRYENYKTLPFGCVGSVAFYFEDYLKETARKRSIIVRKIARSAINGLADYHRLSL